MADDEEKLGVKAASLKERLEEQQAKLKAEKRAVASAWAAQKDERERLKAAAEALRRTEMEWAKTKDHETSALSETRFLFPDDFQCFRRDRNSYSFVPPPCKCVFLFFCFSFANFKTSW
jgi:predicted  nucleic acid-binding Zn-ribbon protein